MPELPNKSSHGAAQHLVSMCSLCGADDDMVTKLGEKCETLRKMVVKTKHKHNVLTKNDIIFQENLMRASADANVIFVVF